MGTLSDAAVAESVEELIDISVRLPLDVLLSVIQKTALPTDDRAARRLALAKWSLAVRRRRPKILKNIQLGEPSWDMLLDPYVADREGHRVDVSGLCLASGVPPSTALR